MGGGGSRSQGSMSVMDVNVSHGRQGQSWRPGAVAVGKVQLCEVKVSCVRSRSGMEFKVSCGGQGQLNCVRSRSVLEVSGSGLRSVVEVKVSDSGSMSAV